MHPEAGVVGPLLAIAFILGTALFRSLSERSGQVPASTLDQLGRGSTSNNLGLITVQSGMLDLHQLPSGREAQTRKHSTNDKACSEGPYAPPQIHHTSRWRGLMAGRRTRAAEIPRVGFMGNSTAALEANLVDSFLDGLHERGYEEGRNIVIEYRWADGKYERFPALVAELIAAKVDVIVTAGTPAALAVKKVTTTVPLVMVAVGDPVGTGLVPSLARPGGNLTGLSSIAPDLEGKRL